MLCALVVKLTQDGDEDGHGEGKKQRNNNNQAATSNVSINWIGFKNVRNSFSKFKALLLHVLIDPSADIQFDLMLNSTNSSHLKTAFKTLMNIQNRLSLVDEALQLFNNTII